LKKKKAHVRNLSLGNIFLGFGFPPNYYFLFNLPKIIMDHETLIGCSSAFRDGRRRTTTLWRKRKKEHVRMWDEEMLTT